MPTWCAKAVAKGGTVLFVGTKRQAQATVQQEADRASMPYINQRWLGGTLTNWVTIKQRIDYFCAWNGAMDAGEFRNLSKKEQLAITARGGEAQPAHRRPQDHDASLPDMLFVVDTNLGRLGSQ